jgi:hypothetical protein
VALIHQAWTFDAADFHRWLASRTVKDGELRTELLRKVAESVFKNASQSTKRALEWMRLDDEAWLEEPGPDESHTDEWYMIALAARLDPAPSLSSNRSPVSYHVLEQVLPLARWSEKDVRLLLYGRPLGTLAAASNNVLAVEFARSLNSYQDRGWLSTHMAVTLLNRLVATESLWASPQSEIEWLNEPIVPAQKPETPLKIAFSDAKEMLETASRREQALFLILD